MTWRSKTFYAIKYYGVATVSALTAIGVVVYERSQRQDNNVYAATKWTGGQHSFNSFNTWDGNWDRRQPDQLVSPLKHGQPKDDETLANEIKTQTPTATRHLILIRHGQYNMDTKDDSGRTLTLLGREQAGFTGQYLKDLNLPYTKLMSSTMTRAIETSDIIHKYLPQLKIERDDLLREGCPILPEPTTTYRPEAWAYKDGARIEAAFRKYFHRAEPEQTVDSYEVYIFHANVIRYFVCRALQFPPEAWLRISLGNGSITQMSIGPSGRVNIRSLGEKGFIPIDKITYT